MTGLRRVLIANRGEIAMRVLRACHESGIEAVAVHSKADTDALWVRHADAAVHIGASPAPKSYLDATALLAAAEETGCDAVHPGYGFLSENVDFARAVGQRGLVFVGPAAEVIEKMGDKATARATAAEADLPVVPGSGAVTDVTAAEQAAAEIGYPVLVKAAAGGGGRGIRPIPDESALAESFPTAHAEAASAFGDGTLYLERALDGARHIEVQILADTHGTVLSLFERDCSVQRRRQKLIEEAPAPGLPVEVRSRLAAAAVRLAEHVGYVGAGTVEFLVDRDGSFYFMEMNTRLQVEHPITECVTGVDLVAEQLRIAADGRLPQTQDDVVRDGAAIEMRINAEDPDNGFAPTPGRLETFDLPGGPGVRVDTGFVVGETISPFYDSMIAKLVCWGADREQAMARARQALRELTISGVSSTKSLHADLLEDPELRQGPVHTTWLENRNGSR